MKLDQVNVHVLTKLCEYLLDGEPVFIIRAQDVAAFSGVAEYINESRRLGGTNLTRSQEQLKKIKVWQENHRDRVKAAD